MNRIHVVGAALIVRGRCLVAQRSARMSAPLKWEFPGGKVEPGESPEAALRRELREELGITVEVGPMLAAGTSEDGARRIELDVYLAELVAGLPEPAEHQAIEWLGPEELPELDWAEADVPVVAALVRHLREREIA